MAIERKVRAMVFPKIGKITIAFTAVFLLIVGFQAYSLFSYAFKPSVKEDTVVYIPTGSDFKYVERQLIEKNIVASARSFRWVARKKKYKDGIKPGRYLFKKGMNTNLVVNILRVGEQSPVRLTFNNVRTWDELAGKVASYLECDSVSFLNTFRSDSIISKYGFTPQTFMAMFIPNTYELHWTTSPEKFIGRMADEYKKFWNDERLQKAKAIGLTPIEVAILASIVQEESNKNDERPVVAGVYLNRLKRGMLLQACPTVKFAVGDFTLRRITTEMTQIDSPYNTYKNAGLPPGPITFPELTSLDAVLNAKQHDYLYFCAKDDFSGYNVFARTLEEHNRNAARYQQALNRNKIWR